MKISEILLLDTAYSLIKNYKSRPRCIELGVYSLVPAADMELYL